MIPALTGPAIRHRPEQFQQVTADFGDYGRRSRRNRLAVGKDNGRLDHGEAPGMTRICRKTPVIPELRPISTATRHTRSHQDIPSCDAALLTLNDLETAVAGPVTLLGPIKTINYSSRGRPRRDHPCAIRCHRQTRRSDPDCGDFRDADTARSSHAHGGGHCFVPGIGGMGGMAGMQPTNGKHIWLQRHGVTSKAAMIAMPAIMPSGGVRESAMAPGIAFSKSWSREQSKYPRWS